MAGDSLEASPQALSMAEVQSSHENSTSPGAASSPRMTKAKPKKRSTVTPRTFTRFFTPRPIVKGKRIGASRRVLKDITASANGNKSLYKDDQLKIGDKSDGFPDIITAKKRKAASGPPIASDEFLAAKRSRKQSVGRSEESETDDCPTEPLGPYSGPAITENLQSNGCDRAANAITRSCYRGSLGRVMVRELDGSRGKASSSHSSGKSHTFPNHVFFLTDFRLAKSDCKLFQQAERYPCLYKSCDSDAQTDTSILRGELQ